MSDLVIQHWFDPDLEPSSAPTPNLDGRINAASVVLASAAMAFAAAGALCASSVAFAAGTVTYAASGIADASSQALAAPTVRVPGLAVASSVAYGSATVAYAASGLVVPSAVVDGSALAKLVAQGIAAPSSVFDGSLTAAFAASGISAPASIVYGSLLGTFAANGRLAPSSVFYGDLQALSSNAINAIAAATSVVFGSATLAVQASGVAAGSSELIGSAKAALAASGLAASASILPGSATVKLQASGLVIEASVAYARTGFSVLVGDPLYIVVRPRTRDFTIERIESGVTVVRDRTRDFTVTVMGFTTRPKLDAEKIPVIFDFSPDLAAGETLVLAGLAVAAAVENGTDPSPSAILAGGNALDATSKQVIVPTQAGVAGVDYSIKVVVATTNALKVLELVGILPVRAKGA